MHAPFVSTEEKKIKKLWRQFFSTVHGGGAEQEHELVFWLIIFASLIIVQRGALGLGMTQRFIVYKLNELSLSS